MADKKSKKPHGLKISRNGSKIICEWKQPSTGYGDGQQFKKGKKKYGKKQEFDWDSVDVGKSATSKTFTINLDNYYPKQKKNYLSKVGFKVRGNRDKDPEKKDKWTWSNWETETAIIKEPKKITSIGHVRNDAYNLTFAAEAGNFSDTSMCWATHIEYQTCIRQSINSNPEKDPVAVPSSEWITPSGSPKKLSSNNRAVSHNINDGDKAVVITNGGSVVRWFRARVVGPRGKSNWLSDYFVYAKPNEPVLFSYYTKDSGGEYNCEVNLKIIDSFARPTDYIEVQYACAAPDVDGNPPANPGWQTAPVGGENDRVVPEKEIIYASGKVKITDEDEQTEWTTYKRYQEDDNSIQSLPVSFTLLEGPTDNQYLYFRAIAHHDGNTYQNASKISIAYNRLTGYPLNKMYVLPKPEIKSIIPVQGSTDTVAVTVTNNADIRDSEVTANKAFLAFELIKEGEEYGKLIGIQYVNGTGDYTKNLVLPSEFVHSDPQGPFTIAVYAAGGTLNSNGKINSISVRSAIDTKSGDVPVPPANVTTQHLGDGNVRVSWEWSWASATSAEIAWSDYEFALESNEPPNTLVVSANTITSRIIKGLTLGTTWYFWVRLIKDDNTSFWSNVVSETPYSSPDTPYLELSREWITLDDKFTARWTYVSTDNTNQRSAIIEKGIIVNNNFVQIGPAIIVSGTAQSVEINPITERMDSGNDYYFRCKVESESGRSSESYSELQKITVVEPLTCEVTQTSFVDGGYILVEEPVVDDLTLYYELVGNDYILTEDTQIVEGKDYYQHDPEPILTQFPLTVTVEGAGDSNWTTVAIVRAENYFLERPDESTRGGYFGEVVYQFTQLGETPITINYEDRLTNYVYFDDEASYYLIARVSDNYGQIVSNVGGYVGTKGTGGIYYPSTEDELGLRFRIGWNHQAVKPVGSIIMDNELLAAIIALEIPETTQDWSYVLGDVYDIYRKSSDGYTLIYEGAIPGETYVDPFPTIGLHGGYRIVYRTLYGDTITEDNLPAWLDFEGEDGYTIYPNYNIIDFGTARAELMFNANFDNSWNKDFKETKYLGGSIQGDWIAGISKSGTISANVLSNDEATVESIHKLARYAGACHVRTTDGSNYMANVDVSENVSHDPYYDPNGNFTKLVSYSLSITRIDSEGTEAVTLDEWNRMNPQENS